MKKLVFFILLSITLVSCEKNIFFQETQKIKGEKWTVKQPCTFSVGVSDINRTYDFYINIRNTTDYKYSNIFFFLTTTYPGGTSSMDTLEVNLSQSDGKWLGTGFGRLKYLRVPVKSAVRFRKAGTYKFSFQQAMRGDIEGIADFGLRIENNSSK